MRIVDSQVHIDVPAGKWRGGHALGYAELAEMMDRVGVERAVVIPPTSSGAGNAYALQAAGAMPTKFAVMGRIPLDNPESRRLLPEWRSNPGMLGVRITFVPHQPSADWLFDGTASWFWPVAEREGIPVMVYAADYLAEIATVAKRHPGLRIAIDHLGWPATASDLDPVALAKRIDVLLRLSDSPNVSVKASALPASSRLAYPFSDVIAQVCRVISAFGPERVFWGSDLTRLNCSYSEAVTMMTEAIECVETRAKELVMGEAICSWLDWRLT
jgi:predicted TIM-barrel fold metal-dependent hydrolase